MRVLCVENSNNNNNSTNNNNNKTECQGADRMGLIIFGHSRSQKIYAKTSVIDDAVVVVVACLTIKVTCVQIAYDRGWEGGGKL